MHSETEVKLSFVSKEWTLELKRGTFNLRLPATVFRTPRKQYMGKRSEEKSYENRRSSADTWDRSFISNLYRNSVKITGVRELSKPQNPVLVVKEKGNYQSLKSRNKVSTFLKIGLPSTCCSQSVEFVRTQINSNCP